MQLSHWFAKLSGKIFSFEGGVCLPEGKKISAGLPIEDFMDPQQEMVFPMLQHQGEPCEVLVREGERVLRDQLIGRPVGHGANVYSSVSGIVKKIEPRLHPSGQMVLSVVIENDHQYETLPANFSPASYKELSKEEILRRIEFAGIVGMGGDGYPTHEKLGSALSKPIDLVILNGCECEPYLSSDLRVMLEDSWRVINGLRIVLSLFPDASGVVAVEENKTEAIKALKEHIEDNEKIRIWPIVRKYPSGDEKMLVEAVKKTQIPSDGLAEDVGCVVINIDTSVAISRAVTQTRPLQRRIVTIAGDCIRTPKNYRVRIGTSFSELIEQVGPLTKRPRRVIYGGPMMGHIVKTLDFPVIKTSTCILLLSSKQTERLDEDNCIRCGQCMTVCPIHLVPYKLYEARKSHNQALFEKLNGHLCTSCGCCSYICPARRDLTKVITKVEAEEES